MKYYLMTALLILALSNQLSAQTSRCCQPGESEGTESLRGARRDTAPGAMSNPDPCPCLETGAVGSEPRLNYETTAKLSDDTTGKGKSEAEQ